MKVEVISSSTPSFFPSPPYFPARLDRGADDMP